MSPMLRLTARAAPNKLTTNLTLSQPNTSLRSTDRRLAIEAREQELTRAV